MKAVVAPVADPRYLSQRRLSLQIGGAPRIRQILRLRASRR